MTLSCRCQSHASKYAIFLRSQFYNRFDDHIECGGTVGHPIKDNCDNFQWRIDNQDESSSVSDAHLVTTQR